MKSLAIGPHPLPSRAVLAPMAGITDLPFRRLCRRFGAGLTTSEMLISNSELWHTRKSHLRLAADDEGPRAVQIAGADPDMMADAARGCEAMGADIIDINMGCPAKKVLKRAAGSALLREPELVEQILRAVVASVSIPVTLKIRTGWSTDQRNGVEIARMAEDLGIQSLAVHGRSRACRFMGEAEYDTIAEIAQALSIPVFANGDIDSVEKAAEVLAYTGADGVMIGRSAQGRPWIFQEINHFLETGQHMAPIAKELKQAVLLEHLQSLHQFYGEHQGLRIARKHCAWYLAQDNTKEQNGTAATHFNEEFRRQFNTLDSASAQLDAIQTFFEQREQFTQDAAA
ncbi:tRNA dihydrouridine synthase DusB [Spongiibacter sp. KMU-158]|uniref:tRNA-dihydrouridine synthase B n=1 Tax=Spongiibacter pelagi TaxID=2760804 RepID=A0A927C2X2_9GAMM|nr:tRNA dihydrouridine synthase DusB [Spongiibacter pelagi]MBD2858641.1 tRNA dihydrouridine synthase DusB [Spongiibacter pelagi]